MNTYLRFLFLLICFFWGLNANVLQAVAQDDSFVEIKDGVPTATWGSIHRFSASCNALETAFTIDVLLPEGYDALKSDGYPVIYANDGQNLFDDAISFAGISWDIDGSLGKLRDKDLISDAIVVGIHNRGTLRPADYIPEKVCKEYIAAADRQNSGMWTLTGGIFNADEYAAFVAGTVKSNIDRLYNTASDRAHTFLMGSSMGALAALYTMCEYPDVFGGAACLSTHWIGDFNYSNTIFPEAMYRYLDVSLPSPSDHKIYTDRGTVDLDAAYAPWETKMRSLMRQKGYDESSGSLLTYTAEGASHNEFYWAQRVDRPLSFLLGLPSSVYESEKPFEEKFNLISLEGSEIIVHAYQTTEAILCRLDGHNTILKLHPGENRFTVPIPGLYILAVSGGQARKIFVRP